MADMIVVKKDLINAYTGEVEEYEFRSQKKRKIKGGFKVVYKGLFELLPEVITSSKDLKIVFYILDSFTYQQKEVNLRATKIAKHFNTSPNKVTLLIKKLIEVEILKRVDRGIYRLNPFIYIPYNANGELLQKEWKEL